MNKGFTLIELLAVIIIISITSMIIFPNVAKVINDSKEDLYKSQVVDIEQAAEKWASDNMDKLDDTHANDIFIPLESLRFSGYLEPDQIKNPKDRSVMDGCIRIRYNLNNKKYNYIYEEKSCSEYSSDSRETEEFGSIIYTYDRTARAFTKDDTNEVVSSAISLFEVNKESIKTIGSTDSGLYDLSDEYVFRGENPNNYVTLTGKDGNSTRNTTTRILSIDKKTNKIKLIVTAGFSNAWDSNYNENDQNHNKIEFKNSSISHLLANGNFYTSKVINADYSIGEVPSNEFSIDALKSVLNDSSVVENKASQKVGTISVLDYVNASASTCDSNYLSDACATNNYLRTLFGNSSSTWTTNYYNNQVWYVNNQGILSLAAPTEIKQIYYVVTLDSNTYISNISTATGTSANPYIIK